MNQLVKCTQSNIFEIREYPLILDPDSFVPLKRIEIKWVPEYNSKEEIHEEVLIDTLLEDLRKILSKNE